MRNILLLSLALLTVPTVTTSRATALQAQPAAPAPGPAPAPAQPRPAAQRPPARTSIEITVTDPKGATLPGIHVAATGPVNREGESDESGTVHFTNVRAGTYRLRFS